jgi:hypothetical protein
MTTYENHYSASSNKCFAREITNHIGPSDTLMRHEVLVDVNDHKELGDFSGAFYHPTNEQTLFVDVQCQ